MRETRMIWWMVLLAAVLELGPGLQAQDAAAKAQQLLAQARAALGGEKLKALQSLSIEGSYRRIMGQGMEMSGDLTYDLLLPDKMMRVDTMRPFGDIEINNMEVVNGDTVWTDQSQSGGGGANVVIRRGGAGGGDPKRQQESINQNIRSDFAHTTLGLLLTTVSSFPVEYAFAGEADSPEGKADVLDVKGPNGFAARLFLDQKSHRPLMLTCKSRRPHVMMRTTTSGPPSEHDLEKQLKEAEAAPEVEHQVRYSAYKEINGISLPHKVSRGIEGETSEEIEFKKVKVNPSLKPEKFVKK